MKRSVNLSNSRKARNVTNDIAAFLHDLGYTAAMLRDEQERADHPAAIEQSYQSKADPNCSTCHGEGHYYEDVCGDGGPQMFIQCECTGG